MALKTTVNDAVRAALLRNNLRITRTIDSERLAGFFRDIKPVSTNHELIRVGGESDGGYLIPDDLEGIGTCFSPGVSSIADFELGMASRGIHCFLADYSVERPPVENPLFHFEKKFLGPAVDSVHTTLEDWVQRNAPDQREFLLQMDIEGGEYGVIFDTSAETLRKFRILVIEFHAFGSLCDQLGFELIDLTFKKLLKDFAIVHIHPNNSLKPIVYAGYTIPITMEFTFLRKDRISSSHPATKFPHALDRPNVPGNEDPALPSCWF
jgi:hypothetical protein